MDFQQVRHSIDVVIQRIKAGRLGLPDFQRSFVWNPSQVAELLDSVARQWPIGSLLLLSGPQPFAFREIDSAPKLNGNDLDLYILDGQQRVTALYHAVANVSKYCYYVDFNELKSGTVDLIKWSGRTSFERQFGDISDRARAGIALIADLWEQPTFFTWLGHIRKDSLRMECLQIRDEKLSGLQSKIYHVMALELEQGIGLEPLARIFETINRTGVALNAFDLLVAKLYPTGFNLRKKWEEAVEDNPMLKHFQPNEMEVLKLISLLIRRRYGRKASRGVRQGDLLALDAAAVIGIWEEGVSKYVEALNTALSFGVVCRDLVPSWSMILGLAGCNDILTPQETFDWWRTSIARQIFAQGANTKIVAEFDSSMRIARQQLLDEIGLDDISRRQVRANGLLSNGVFSLIIKNGGRDPVTGGLLSHASAVTAKSISSDGRLGNVTYEDMLSNVVLMSADSGKSLKRGEHIDALRAWREGLYSQGIDAAILNRPSKFIVNLLTGDGR